MSLRMMIVTKASLKSRQHKATQSHLIDKYSAIYGDFLQKVSKFAQGRAPPQFRQCSFDRLCPATIRSRGNPILVNSCWQSYVSAFLSANTLAIRFHSNPMPVVSMGVSVCPAMGNLSQFGIQSSICLRPLIPLKWSAIIPF